jgi:hypothetical protein
MMASTPPAPLRPPAEGLHNCAEGITPAELATRVHRSCGADAADLAAWLVDERLAELRGGLLTPTRLAVELGASIGDALETR